MEESCEVHSEEDKVLSEKNKKRRLKTPSQVEGLEKFYNEHRYPTESMKFQLAEKLGLTEKQISGWFCHRRLKDKRLLKDEACANGRLDRSSGVIQDHGSGLGQDSCGSTKPGDYKHVDPREVESRRLYGQEFPAADITYEKRGHYTGNFSGMDDTSSESSSALQDRLFPQTKDPYDMETSRYLTQNGAIVPINVKGAQNRGSMRPSGYLKVKGNVEHAAVTAVKRQLGSHFREDGPPLGVEFQPLPPGAFETPTRDPVHEVTEPYYGSDLVLPHSPDISGVRKQSGLSTRHDICNSKMSSQDSYMKSENFKTIHGSDSRNSYSHHQLKQNSSFPNYSKPFPGRNSSLDKNEDSAGEPSIYNGKRSLGMRSKHGVEGLRLDSVSNHHLHLSGEKVICEQTEPYLHKYDGVSRLSPKIVQRREQLKSKPPNSKLRHSESLDMEERGLARMMAKDKKLYRGRIAMKEYHDQVGVKMHPTNEMMKLPKRVREEYPQQDYVKKGSFTEMLPWSNQIKGSAAEMPSSFSEDETAETSSSMR